MPRSLSDKRIELSAGVHDPQREFWLDTQRTLAGTARAGGDEHDEAPLLAVGRDGAPALGAATDLDGHPVDHRVHHLASHRRHEGRVGQGGDNGPEYGPDTVHARPRP